MATDTRIKVGDPVHVEFDGEVIEVLGTTACRVEYSAGGSKYSVLVATNLVDRES